MTPTPMQSYAGRVRAPEFPTGLDWLNVAEPLTIAQLRGKVVLLDFWTYGCINCIHIIPDLKRLEAEFGDALVVIGVHSAKFENEGDTANIRRIAQRYEIEHPIVNDRDYAIWTRYSVRAWPTVMVIDPLGRVLGYVAGEGIYNSLQPIIAGMIAEFEAQSLIDRTPILLSPEMARREGSLLAFPGKVLADAPGNRLFISDTNHHRIVIARLDSHEVLAVVGSGQEGLQDGDYTAATFDWPHGLALHDEILYVADTRNHAIRAIDLRTQTVTTIAGTGAQNRDYLNRLRGGPALEMPLNSPWDVAYHDGILYIAMAGPHQLWAFDLAAGTVNPHAGSGREGIIDGPLLEAQLAQPSGIVTDGQRLFFADAESSAIRVADIDPQGEVRTIVGTGLFDFGDVDGVGDAVRLQHALGLTLGPDGLIYVADTYNSRIKVIDPATREARTLAGDGHGFRDGTEPQFHEPGGISYADGRLYIADTNNDAIRVLDLATGEVTTVIFPNPEALSRRPEAPVFAGGDMPPAEWYGEIVHLESVAVAPGQGRIVLDVTLPEGYAFNGLAPFTMRAYNDNPVTRVADADNDLRIVLPEMPVIMPVTLAEGTAALTIDVALYYCEAVNETLCFPLNVRFTVGLEVRAGGGTDITIPYTVVPPELPGSNLGGN